MRMRPGRAGSLTRRRWAARTIRIAAVALVVALLIWFGVPVAATMADLATAQPIYTVEAVEGHLALDAGRWVQRAILVRGEIGMCMAGSAAARFPCTDWQPGLFDPGREAVEPLLPLVPAGTDPRRAFLRGLPLLGHLVPAPQTPRWGAVATYRLRIRRTPCGGSRAIACYAALMLDAADWGRMAVHLPKGGERSAPRPGTS